MKYVVQRMDSIEVVVGHKTPEGEDLGEQIAKGPKVVTEKRDYWVDIATVTVEPRTKRSTVIKRALAEANISAGGDPPKLRALDAESAEVHEPEAFQPPMEWRL